MINLYEIVFDLSATGQSMSVLIAAPDPGEAGRIANDMVRSIYNEGKLSKATPTPDFRRDITAARQVEINVLAG